MVVKNDANIALECVLYLCSAAANESHYDFIINAPQNHCINDRPSVRLYLNEIKAFEKYMSGFTADKKRVAYFFKTCDGIYTPFGKSRAALIFKEASAFGSIGDFRMNVDKLLMLEEQRRMSLIVENMFADDTTDSVRDIPDMDSNTFMAVVSSHENAELARIAIDCYLNFDRYVEEIRDIFLTTYDFALQYDGEFFEAGKKLFEKYCACAGDISRLFKKLALKDENDFLLNENLVVTPVFSAGVMHRNADVPFIGVNPLLLIPNNEPLSAESINNIFRLLADPTRMRIMREISESQMNTKQLADELNLTSATISHHISELREHELIISTHSGNKVFYMSNATMLQSFFDCAERYLMSKS